MRGKVVVITGASGGIGAALARKVGREGGRPVLAARRRPELEKVAAESGPDALVVVADVTRREQIRQVLDAAIARFDHVDVWVNNAGRGITRRVAELTDEELDEMMLVNVKSVLYGMQTVLPHFQERGRGHIINISSMLGRVPFFSARSAYSAAKHAMNALTANFRMDLAEKWPDIHVSTILPGVVATDFGNHALGGGPDSRTLPYAQSPEEVADVIADVIERPRADVYTRPELRQRVVDYFAADDMAAAEAGMATARPTGPRGSRP
jgi:NAD(P)-dependent dehydrogenase (short-subunit alcohol dehydrogenase family)